MTKASSAGLDPFSLFDHIMFFDRSWKNDRLGASDLGMEIASGEVNLRDDLRPRPQEVRFRPLPMQRVQSPLPQVCRFRIHKGSLK